MHQDLGTVAQRRGYAWIMVAALLMGSGPGIGGLVMLGPPAGLAGAVLGTGAALVVLVTFTRHAVSAASPQAPAHPATGRLANLAEGIALAMGRRPAQVMELDHAAPNVAVLPAADDDRLYVTRGAIERLTRDQLEAVCAAQMAIAHHTGVRRLLHAGALLAGLRLAVFFGIFPIVVSALVLPGFAPLFLVVLLVPVAAAAWLCGGRVTWWAAVATDAVCVHTTRHPQALVAALVALARWNGVRVPVGGRFSAVNAFWAIRVGADWSMTTTVNGRVTQRRSAEQDSDIRALLRAGVVRRVCLEGRPATLASYDEVARHLRRAGAAAAAGGVAVVEGVEIGLDGVVGGDVGPVA